MSWWVLHHCGQLEFRPAGDHLRDCVGTHLRIIPLKGEVFIHQLPPSLVEDCFLPCLISPSLYSTSCNHHLFIATSLFWCVFGETKSKTWPVSGVQSFRAQHKDSLTTASGDLRHQSVVLALNACQKNCSASWLLTVSFWNWNSSQGKKWLQTQDSLPWVLFIPWILVW